MKKLKYNRLKAVMAEKGISNVALAEYLGTSPQVVSTWVTNKHQPTIQTLHIIASFLQVNIHSLLLKDPVPFNDPFGHKK